jgi:hypothetical protein
VLELVHRHLDTKPKWRQTWEYERAARISLEIVLLVACAIPVIMGWRSAFGQFVLFMLRVWSTWMTHEARSIRGRGKEQGHTITNLPEHKQRALTNFEQAEILISWVWPGLLVLIPAVETWTFTLAAGLNLVATMIRITFDTVILPAWRKSRLAWKARPKT